MSKRDHKSKPAPRTSPATDHRRVVIQHGNETSVGTKPMDRRKAILDPQNGRGLDGGSGGAPGSNVTVETDDIEPSSW
jgi:hypothetical protein